MKLKKKSNRGNQQNEELFLWKINRTDKQLVILTKEKKRKDPNYQYQEWKRRYYSDINEVYRHQKDEKGILQTTLYT